MDIANGEQLERKRAWVEFVRAEEEEEEEEEKIWDMWNSRLIYHKFWCFADRASQYNLSN